MKLTTKMLKRLIEEEAAKFKGMEDVEDVSADEKDADELADSLEKKIDYVKALKIEESRLIKRLKSLQSKKERVLKTF